MSFTQSDVDVLKKAIASGVSSVRFADGRQVNYRSMGELLDALATAQAEVSASAGGAVGMTYASFSKE